VIAVRDQQVAVPEGATGVSYRSEEYYRLLAQARYIVANTHLPSCFRRAEGQTVLQTWHGVGTKKIGLDMGAVHFANKSYVENIRNGESDQWDYLVSPNPFTSPILRRAFAYRGHLLETGVPRNDIFHRADRDARALAVKQRLGIEADRKVVLYAPTWRDNLFDGPGRYRLDLRLDLYEAVRKLGDDYVLLFRKHSNIVDRLPLGEGAVIDASDYPEVQELLLATDVLISDYSTLMCDFANTGRPMLFYTYDLANYRDVLRGFYFDFEDEVPGPLITDEADLVAAIADADAIRAEYDAKYRAFAERFCAWDDGRATERVVDAVFGEVR
jgi:CDP-glycerol glycerophosphotransferase